MHSVGIQAFLSRAPILQTVQAGAGWRRYLAAAVLPEAAGGDATTARKPLKETIGTHATQRPNGPATRRAGKPAGLKKGWMEVDADASKDSNLQKNASKIDRKGNSDVQHAEAIQGDHFGFPDT